MTERAASDVCQCGHLYEDHDDGVRCGVVVRPDGTGCRCRRFSAYHPRERDEDDGLTYGDPRDERDARRFGD